MNAFGVKLKNAAKKVGGATYRAGKKTYAYAKPRAVKAYQKSKPYAKKGFKKSIRFVKTAETSAFGRGGYKPSRKKKPGTGYGFKF